MKIKVIDLLNKIANGEEVPKKIKYLNVIYTYDTYNYDVGYVNKDKMSYRWFIKEIDVDVYDCLNGEVEIVEDTPKKIDRIGNDYYHKEQDEINEIFQRKINEIIDYLNKGE